MMGRREPAGKGIRALALFGGILASGLPAAADQGWPQWGGNPQHTGASPAIAQPLEAILADILYDPHVEIEKAEGFGSLFVHYAVPLVDGDGVYMAFKSGSYVACDPPGSGEPAPCGRAAWGSQTWSVKKLRWENAELVEVWTFTSDWKPEPFELALWEPVFLPVLAGAHVYVPGVGGSVFKVSKSTGLAESRIQPFADLNPHRYVAGGLAAGPDGGVVYNALQLDPVDPFADVEGAWLVRISPGGETAVASFSTLVSGAPAPGAACEGSFANEQLPWPPSASAAPTFFECGSQRPGLNVVPAIAPDGTIYTVSRAHANSRYGYLVAVHADLTPSWSASFRGRLNDGCGVLIPPNGTPGGCRNGAALGVDPQTNATPAGRVQDTSTSSPMVLPDNTVVYGTYSRYNRSRGHLMRFSAEGAFLGSYDFGWDITPAVLWVGDTYRIVNKDNHYDTGSYCGNPDFCPIIPSDYDITALTGELDPVWSFRNTTDVACRREASGDIVCVPWEEVGFEWCVNQPATDAAGVTVLNAEDGYLYALDPDGTMRERIFLDEALGAAYTPLSIGPDGVVYSQNNGRLFAVGKRKTPRRTPEGPVPGNTGTRVVERD